MCNQYEIKEDKIPCAIENQNFGFIRLLEENKEIAAPSAERILCYYKWKYKRSYIKSAEKDMKTSMIIAAIYTTKQLWN